MKPISPATDPAFWSNWIQPPEVLDGSRRRRFRPALVEHFRDLLGIAADARVLDVGCGPGTLTRFVAKHVAASLRPKRSERTLEHGDGRHHLVPITLRRAVEVLPPASLHDASPRV